jgi:hypothetical protein
VVISGPIFRPPCALSVFAFGVGHFSPENA